MIPPGLRSGPLAPYLKRAAFLLLHIANRGASLRRKILSEDLTVVLNLHRVSPVANPFWGPLHPKIFEDTILFLKRHATITTFSHIASAPTDRPRVILSFDDGYRDFHEFALPIVRRHGIPVNMNIIPSCVETGRPPAAVELLGFLNAASAPDIARLRLPGFSGTLAGPDPTSKLRYGLRIARFLEDRSHAEREPLRDRVATWARAAGVAHGTPMMNAQQIRELAADPLIDLGVHSYAHDSMAFESDEFFSADLDRCADYLADLGESLETYAFPNGSHRRQQVIHLQEKGVRNILLVEEKLARGTPRVYPRLTFYADTSAEAKLRAFGWGAKGVL